METDKTGTDTKFVTLKRSPDEKEPWKYFFREQRIEEQDTKSTDCHLICSDGFVPAHSLVLQVVSPFFDAIFAGQCPCLKPRRITMQDYKVTDVRRLVELIYTGEVIVISEEQVEAIKDMIKSFQILAPVTLECIIEVIKPSRGRPVVREEQNALFFPFDKNKTAKENLEVFKARPIVSLARINAGKVKVAANTTAANANATAVAVVVPGTSNKANKKIPAKVVTAPPGVTPPAAKTARADPVKSTQTKPDQKSDSESDDDGQKAVNASREWFLEEAKRCQYCDVRCKTAAAASSCLTSHSRLRCYFCFKVVKNTERLFQHFSEKHKKAGRENCLLCPLCETIVPFKSVSCHVISLHLSDTKNSTSGISSAAYRGKASDGVKVGRPPSNSNAGTNGNSMPPPTKTRTGKRSGGARKDTEEESDGGTGGTAKKKKHTLPDLNKLNASFKMQSICGRIRVFAIEKSRGMDCSTAKI